MLGCSSCAKRSTKPRHSDLHNLTRTKCKQSFISSKSMLLQSTTSPVTPILGLRISSLFFPRYFRGMPSSGPEKVKETEIRTTCRVRKQCSKVIKLLNSLALTWWSSWRLHSGGWCTKALVCPAGAQWWNDGWVLIEKKSGFSLVFSKCIIIFWVALSELLTLVSTKVTKQIHEGHASPSLRPMYCRLSDTLKIHMKQRQMWYNMIHPKCKAWSWSGLTWFNTTRFSAIQCVMSLKEGLAREWIWILKCCWRYGIRATVSEQSRESLLFSPLILAERKEHAWEII